MQNLIIFGTFFGHKIKFRDVIFRRLVFYYFLLSHLNMFALCSMHMHIIVICTVPKYNIIPDSNRSNETALCFVIIKAILIYDRLFVSYNIKCICIYADCDFFANVYIKLIRDSIKMSNLVLLSMHNICIKKVHCICRLNIELCSVCVGKCEFVRIKN